MDGPIPGLQAKSAAVRVHAHASSGEALAAQVDRWSALLAGAPWTDETWTDVKGAAGPALEQVKAALAGGRRLYALLRLGPIGTNLAAAEYLHALPEERWQDPAFFEAEWTRTAGLLAVPGVSDLQPAAVRAISEAAVPQAPTGRPCHVAPIAWAASSSTARPRVRARAAIASRRAGWP